MSNEVKLLTAEMAKDLLLDILPEVAENPERFSPVSELGKALEAIASGRAVVSAAPTQGVGGFDEEALRDQFEERAFNTRFISGISKPNPGSQFPFAIDCPPKAEFCARNADGEYAEASLNPAWWGFKTAHALKASESSRAQVELWGYAHKDGLMAANIKVYDLLKKATPKQIERYTIPLYTHPIKTVEQEK